MRLNVRFAGAGGQGVISSSVLLAKAYGIGEDYNVSQTQSYGPEARGGACKAEVVVSDENIDYMYSLPTIKPVMTNTVPS